ncbi:MAG: hypothetical protein RBR62_05480 [Bacteroidales bacterium]|jgi:cation transport ATPase|nr:hypothetical protein [Bacteroidales bacterium]HHU98152.1 hypothetical protein [Petrimonas sp.]
MGVPDKRYLYVIFYGAFVAQLTGILLLVKPSTHILLLALLYLVNAEVALFIWAMNKTNQPDRNGRKAIIDNLEEKREERPGKKTSRELKMLFYIGILTMIAAIACLVFKNHLQGYVVQITAGGLAMLLSIQWNSNAKLYSLTKRKTALAFLVTIIVLTAFAILFVIALPFTLEIRFKVLAFLCFGVSGVLLLNYSYAMRLIKRYSVSV